MNMDMNWSRACPTSVEVRRCTGDDARKGQGLFACREFKAGEALFEENPISGTAILLFGEKEASDHCDHCTCRLPLTRVVCPRGCAAKYCSEQCREEAWWVHHEILCTAVSPAWGEFLEHSKACSNEYYVLAARMVTYLRHLGECPVTGTGAPTVPWSAYASPPWWETMQRPVYSSSSSSGDSGSCSGSCSGEHPDVGSGLDRVHTGSGQINLFDDCSSAESAASGEHGDTSTSLTTFFRSKIQDQTHETVELLRRVLSESQSLTPWLNETLVCESFGRLVGLLRVNVISVRTGTAGTGDSTETCLRGMALYPVASSMNHSNDANCYAGSNPSWPSRASIHTLVPISCGQELCINYLAGAPYGEHERAQILRVQYCIVDGVANAS